MLHVLPSQGPVDKAHLGQKVGLEEWLGESLKIDIEVHTRVLWTGMVPRVENVFEGCLVVAVGGVLVEGWWALWHTVFSTGPSPYLSRPVSDELPSLRLPAFSSPALFQLARPSFAHALRVQPVPSNERFRHQSPTEYADLWAEVELIELALVAVADCMRRAGTVTGQMDLVCVTVYPGAWHVDDIAQSPPLVASYFVRLTQPHYYFALVVL